MLRQVLIAIALVSLASSAAWSESVTTSEQIDELKNNFFTDDVDSDLNGDGVVDFLDLALLGSRTGASAAATQSLLGEPVNMLFFTPMGESDVVTQVSVTDQDPLFLDLNMSFDQTTSGGGIDILFDAGVLEVVAVTFSNALGDDINFRCPTDPMAPAPIPTCPNDPIFLSWGNIGGITGDKLVATIELGAIATGSSSISFDVTVPFADTSGGSGILTVVPEPAFGGLAALATLVALKVRRRTV